ncbi:MAG TPA: hypothetical protein VHM67_02360 [Gemmatimonadaceae bacterium]|nr:hypothetical protein [Gemmatimonadaceae bacterium]
MRKLVLIAGAALVAQACTENLDAGRACPAFCPNPRVTIADTVIPGVLFDATVLTPLFPGEEGMTSVARRNDGGIDLRAVARFDTLVDFFNVRRNGADVLDTVRVVTDARLALQVSDSTYRATTDSITFAVYNVDTSGVADTAVAPVAALFRPDRLVGTRRAGRGQMTDTSFTIPISDTLVNGALARSGRVRLGVRIQSGGDVHMGILRNMALRARPVTRVAGDSLKDSVATFGQSSLSPRDDGRIAGPLSQYTLVVKGTDAPPAGVISATTFPQRRAYLRFEIPRKLVDSTQILRATLRLTQLPSPVAFPNDTADLYLLVGLARATITDTARASLITESITAGRGAITGEFGRRVSSSGSGLRLYEIVPQLRAWRGTDPGDEPYAIILRVEPIWVAVQDIRFASTESGPATRPTLQITYVPTLTTPTP